MWLHETSLFAIKIIDFPVFDESVTDGPTDGRTHGRADPLIEMRGRIEKRRTRARGKNAFKNLTRSRPSGSKVQGSILTDRTFCAGLIFKFMRVGYLLIRGSENSCWSFDSFSSNFFFSFRFSSIIRDFLRILDASSHLYERVCPSVGRSVGPLVTLSWKTRTINIFE